MSEHNISIIIPCYNHGDTLAQSLESVRSQTCQPHEIIIIDDGSDHPVSLELGDRDKLTVIRTENRGAPAARNRGFRASSGRYVIFWDADVIAKPDMLERLLRQLEKCEDAAYSYSHHWFGRKRMPAVPFDESELRNRNYIHSTTLIRREAVIPWDESLRKFQDWDLWLTMASEGKTGILVPEYLFTVIPRQDGMSSWLPRYSYREPFCRLPWIRKKVATYEQARHIIREKHRL